MTRNFGTTKKGEKATLYLLKNRQGMEAKITDYGATLVRLLVPGQSNQTKDVVLGYDNVQGYEKGTLFFGGIIGRVANRIGGGKFQLSGKCYELKQNDNGNTLHSGRDFYNKRMWKVVEADDSHVAFLLKSRDMDQGFPGNVDVCVTYRLTQENELEIRYQAVPDQDTLLNLTNHSYFNLSGHASGDVLNQKVMIDADTYTRTDAQSVPTGEITLVDGTPMDFRRIKRIGQNIADDYEALIYGNGYDHNWVLSGRGFRRAAAMYAEDTKIYMEVYTDLPGMQFYTANFVENEPGKEGVVYGRRQAACFETQYFPDAIHKEHFEGPVIKAGQTYKSVTIYKFSCI